jgi:hypothetical protein
MGLVLQRETYPPVLLERKAKKLRKETGNQKLRSALQSPKTPRELFLIAIIRPLKMLFMSPIIFGLSVFIAITYGYLYILFTTITFVFTENYGISERNVGLVFLGLGAGQFVALLSFGFTSDKILKRMAKGGEMKPEYRLPLLWPFGACVPIGLLFYGWTAEYKIHWIVPIIGTGILGIGMLGVFMPLSKSTMLAARRIEVLTSLVCSYISRRCLYSVCSKCHGGKHYLPKPWWSFPSPGRTEIIRSVGARLGQQFACIHCDGIHANDLDFHQVRRAHQDTSEMGVEESVEQKVF